MKQTTLDDIFQIVANVHHTTVEEVRAEIQEMIEEAQNTRNPRARILWASIPQEGDTPTLEELIQYLAASSSPFDPLPDSASHIPC